MYLECFLWCLVSSLLSLVNALLSLLSTIPSYLCVMGNNLAANDEVGGVLVDDEDIGPRKKVQLVSRRWKRVINEFKY